MPMNPPPDDPPEGVADRVQHAAESAGRILSKPSGVPTWVVVGLFLLIVVLVLR